jgi:hypothetical protein
MSNGRILESSTPYFGLPRIVNVLWPVGFNEQNDPDDVRVVQNLLPAITLHKRLAGSIGIPQVTGRYDALTGFWIFNWQAMTQDDNVQIDGVVSPAQKGAYYGETAWLIVRMNQAASAANPTVYQRFVAAMAGGVGNPGRHEFGFPSDAPVAQ